MTICSCEFILALIIKWLYIAELFVVDFNSLGNLSSSANVVDMRLVSPRGLQKVGSNHRNFRVHALFGGKKDNESGDNKVSNLSFLLPSMLCMNEYSDWVTNLHLHPYLPSVAFFCHLHKWQLLRTMTFFIGMFLWWKHYRFCFSPCLIFISLVNYYYIVDERNE